MASRQWLPSEINDQTLNYYYTLSYHASGYYYHLKTTLSSEDPNLQFLPARFWLHERAALQASSSPSVTSVRVVVHTSGRIENSQRSDNHWSMFLITGARNSVRINMRAEDIDYVNGVLEVTNHEYVLSNSTLQHWDFAVNNGFTVKHFTDLIYENKREIYNMSGGGSGCRYWQYVVLGDFARSGFLVDANAATILWPNLLFSYARDIPREALPMVMGQFDVEDEEEDEDEDEDE